ncbi:MAG: amidase, partial [Shimia sp.]
IFARPPRPRARAEARAARARAGAGLRRGPLDGVPISWKDLFDSASTATEAGSHLLRGRVPDRDAEVLANATAQGTVCLGKTHMTEIAYSGLGLNPNTGTPPCVNDAEAAPGGSSSGAAASLAFGLAAGAIGSDTGGSVRIPAAWNDLVGLKTTAGRVSVSGVVALSTYLDTVGPLGRSVEDCALLLAALEGRRAPDLRGATLAGARMLVIETIAFDDIEDAPLRAFDEALARLGRAGLNVDRAPSPALAEAFGHVPTLYGAETLGHWRDEIAADTQGLMFREIRERLLLGEKVGGPEYVAARRGLERLRPVFDAQMAPYDAVILPTCPILPPNLARMEADTAFYKRANLMALRNTRIANLMGGASITLPTGVPSCGVMLIGPPASEERLLRLGAAMERALA